jgi:hypothetical protein
VDWVRGCASEWVTADTRVYVGRCLFWGVILNASLAGGDISIYDGHDATSGRLIGHYDGAVNATNPVTLKKPINVYSGLYVVVTNVVGVTVLFEPVDEIEQ